MEQLIGGGRNTAGAQAVIKDTTAANFGSDVIESSQEIPILVDFWAPWCGPCKQLTPILEKAVNNSGGKVRLVKLNIDEAPQIAQQMRIQSIPAVYAFFQGRPVDGFMGAVPESQVKSFIQKIIKTASAATGPSPIDDAIEQAKAAFDSGDASTASALYGQILQQEPNNIKALAGMGRCYLATGQIESAKNTLASIPDEEKNNPETVALRAALELNEQAQEASGETSTLEKIIKNDPDNLQAHFDLAVSYFSNGTNGKAIDALIEILRKNRNWKENAAKEQLVKIFEALGSSHPDTIEGRQKMASVMFS